MTDPRDYSLIPPLVLEGLRRYAMDGVPVGSLLRAVIANDFIDAVGRADLESMRALPAIACYVYDSMPSICWGSRRVYKAWLLFQKGRRDELDIEELQVLADIVSEARRDAEVWRME